jgi:small subunit ribosomal protein S3
MSRREAIIQGSIKLATLDANIDYGFAIAQTSYGTIGCKCWIFRGWYEGTQKETAHGLDA